MVLSKRSFVLNAFLLMHATSATAKGIRSAEREMQVGQARFYDGSASSDSQDEVWEHLEMQQMEMSMPTVTPPPTPPPTMMQTPPPTPPPTVVAAPTDVPLPALFLDEDDEFEEFGLVECQGDCDDDTDCAFGLICFQRELGEQDVPGCMGNADDVGDGFDDFCIIPPTLNTLVIVGDEGSPASAYPLGLCQGDCDEDIDCQTGLSCIQRDLDEIVPGCVGFGGSGWDYCAVPSSAGGALEYLGDEEWDFYELQECQGDCDFDSDCALGLVCNFRDAGDGGVVPGCEGNAEDIATGSEDFCIQRPSDFYLVILADDEEPGGFPLPVCAGDCDNDTECQDGLVCLQRDFEEPVAECEGPGEEGYDYCIPA